MNTREMAKEADCLDFYNYVYMPFSGCVHSMWQHIGRYNLDTCKNPLHRYHKIPSCPTFQPDIDFLCLSAKYLHKTFSAFDRATGISLEGHSAFECLMDAIAKLGEEVGCEASEES